MIPQLFTIIAQSAPAAGGSTPTPGFGLQQILMMGAMVVMFYFLLIRPQQRQRKELQKRIDSMQAGDKVVTTAGIHGLIHNLKEKTVVIKIADSTMVEFDKTAVAHVIKKDA
ncbi:MAG TPA: preprotein translocase subunit YajC [Verrucomicrobiales bacterium]|nr:MAG: preprotein translocase subunit YajC [Verrucomicrobiae bacterium Tous-C3TDCM]PAZ06854.1 MAG: preprotein translocase subunit YajC [Verrucomicrobiae bacterium AMD-G2]HBE23466.1 preprotein translocase subunit YajC [Verrucomicrobiales bacterium]